MMEVDDSGQVFQDGTRLARFDSENQLYDGSGTLLAVIPAEGPVRAADGGELPFVISADGTMWVEGQRVPARFDDTGKLHYPAVDDPRVRVVGDLERYGQMAMLLILHQSGFLSLEFQQSVRRAKARQAERGLQSLFEKLSALWVAEGETAVRQLFQDPLGPAPAPGCDARPWPEDADARWQTLDFRVEQSRYSFTVERQATGFQLIAEGDLDCDDTHSRFVMTVAPGAEGDLVAGGDTDVQNQLE